MTRPSGPAWCSEFPCSVLTTQLAQPFRDCAERFLAALRSAGASVTASTTFRPRERAYLMHWAWRVAHGLVAPSAVPALPGVDIDWTHGGCTNAAIAAATEMVSTYGIAFQPSLNSRHIEGRAIDMTIRINGPIKITDAHDVIHLCTKTEDLYAIGASYGVYKLLTDSPHWSEDGR